jgi:hypothetical protein
MQHAGWRKPPLLEYLHSFPCHAVTLTPAPQGAEPQTADLGAKSTHGVTVRRHSMVGEVSSHNLAEPTPLFRDGLMSSTLHLDFHLAQLRSHPLLYGVPFQFVSHGREPARAEPPHRMCDGTKYAWGSDRPMSSVSAGQARE